MFLGRVTCFVYLSSLWDSTAPGRRSLSVFIYKSETVSITDDHFLCFVAFSSLSL